MNNVTFIGKDVTIPGADQATFASHNQTTIRMKKLKLLFITTFLLLYLAPAHAAASVPFQALAATGMPVPTTGNVTELTSRLAEIKAMDKSGLKASEKKQLRKEKRSIKSELRKVSGGVYVSAGALLVLLIILILVL